MSEAKSGIGRASFSVVPGCRFAHPGYGLSLFDMMARQTRAHSRREN
jgi:hypothetical protein